jgi:DNA-binding MarR family transcriptional regulator
MDMSTTRGRSTKSATRKAASKADIIAADVTEADVTEADVTEADVIAADVIAPSDAIQQFCWDIATIDAHLNEIRFVWAASLGVTMPQWMILAAVEDMDTGDGVTADDLSSRLLLDAAFVARQSRTLESKGLVRRIQSRDPKRQAIALTDVARGRISRMSESRHSVENFIFADFDGDNMKDFLAQVGAVKAKCEKVKRLICADRERS